MNQTPYIIASFVLVFFGTMALIVSSYVAMRRAEGKVEKMGKRK